jgi:hypothetical protein
VSATRTVPPVVAVVAAWRLRRSAQEEVVKPAEEERDVPTKEKALDQAEKKAAPAQQREARQEDLQKCVLDR